MISMKRIIVNLKKTTDMNERGLFSRLKGLRGNPQKIQALKKYDKFNLLEEE